MAFYILAKQTIAFLTLSKPIFNFYCWVKTRDPQLGCKILYISETSQRFWAFSTFPGMYFSVLPFAKALKGKQKVGFEHSLK